MDAAARSRVKIQHEISFIKDIDQRTVLAASHFQWVIAFLKTIVIPAHKYRCLAPQVIYNYQAREINMISSEIRVWVFIQGYGLYAYDQVAESDAPGQ